MGQVVRLDAHASVPAGSFDDVLVTLDWTPLEPEVTEKKCYAPGVGFVLERKVRGGNDRVELVKMVEE